MTDPNAKPSEADRARAHAFTLRQCYADGGDEHLICDHLICFECLVTTIAQARAAGRREGIEAAAQLVLGESKIRLPGNTEQLRWALNDVAGRIRALVPATTEEKP